MPEKLRVPLEKAAFELGVGKQAVRENMKRCIWDLGEVITPQQSKKSTYSYHIYRTKLDKHMGKIGEQS